MSLVEKKIAKSETLFLRVLGNRLTAEHVLAFAEALRENDVPGSTMITADRDHSTLHTTSLSCRVSLDEVAT